jgi:GPH family glycoside/pentoside/hexuronide:cation symporter
VFNLTLGLPSTWVGLGQAVPRLAESIFNPWIGHATDRLQTRWGRRRPVMLLGAVCSACFFALIWWFPRGMSPGFYLGYLLVSATLFHLSASCFTIPWDALLLELSDNHHERTSLQVYRSIIATLGALVMPWMLAATQWSFFSDTISGVRIVGLVVGAMLLVAGLIPAVFIREKAVVVPTVAPRLLSLRDSLREVMGQRPFLILIGMMLLYGPGIVLAEDFSIYVNVYHVFAGDLRAASILEGYQGTLLYTGKFVWVPVMGIIVRRMGKRRTLMLCFGLSAISDVMRWFCYTPAHPYLQLAVPLVQSMGMAPAWVLMFSMMADVLDEDERITGRRRAGVFVAFSQWIRKTGLAIAFGLSGLVLAATGFSVIRGTHDPATVTRIRLFFTIVPAVCTLLAIWLAKIYPLTEQRAFVNQAAIDRARRHPRA